MQKKVNITTILEERQGFAWFGNDRCRVRGSFFDSQGNYYSGKAMSEYFGSGDTYAAFSALAAGANGVFSVIRKMPDECWLATDLVRSLPLFYCRTESGWVISNRAERLKDHLEEVEIDALSRLEFRGTGFVTGSETLIKGIFQVQAGEILRLGKAVNQSFHHTYRTAKDIANEAEKEITNGTLKDVNDVTLKGGTGGNLKGRIKGTAKVENSTAASDLSVSDDVLKHAAREKMEHAFKRMVRSLEGRTAVVPLSGGFDSRLIAVMLKQHGYKDVVCFTYGRKGNKEAVLSERVAKALGFPWYFVEYNQQLVSDFLHTSEFIRYYKWASNLTSMFFLQEFFAVKYLQDRKLIPGDAIIIPGHSGDFLGGSQFAKHQLPVLDEANHTLAKRILEVKYHFERYNRSERKQLLDRIMEQLRAKGSGNARSWSVHEDWDLKEKLAKFNVNSASTYTFFGYTFRLPYYDRELVDFFRDLPVSVKRDKSLYDALLINEYFIPYGVDFDEELQTPERAYAIARFRKRIKRLLPRSILALRPQRADLLYYREITARLREDLIRRGGKPSAYGSKYNKMIIDWYLLMLQEKNSNRF